MGGAGLFVVRMCADLHGAMRIELNREVEKSLVTGFRMQGSFGQSETWQELAPGIKGSSPKLRIPLQLESSCQEFAQRRGIFSHSQSRN